MLLSVFWIGFIAAANPNDHDDVEKTSHLEEQRLGCRLEKGVIITGDNLPNTVWNKNSVNECIEMCKDLPDCRATHYDHSEHKCNFLRNAGKRLYYGGHESAVCPQGVHHDDHRDDHHDDDRDRHYDDHRDDHHDDDRDRHYDDRRDDHHDDRWSPQHPPATGRPYMPDLQSPYRHNLRNRDHGNSRRPYQGGGSYSPPPYPLNRPYPDTGYYSDPYSGGPLYDPYLEQPLQGYLGSHFRDYGASYPMQYGPMNYGPTGVDPYMATTNGGLVPVDYSTQGIWNGATVHTTGDVHSNHGHHHR